MLDAASPAPSRTHTETYNFVRFNQNPNSLTNFPLKISNIKFHDYHPVGDAVFHDGQTWGSYNAPYTHSVKPCDFTVWHPYLTEKLSKVRSFWQEIAQASELSFPVVCHTQNSAVHSGNPAVPSVYLPTPRWHHLKAHPFLAVHSADEHRMTYSFSNTTSYSTFTAFFFSFRITLWQCG